MLCVLPDHNQEFHSLWDKYLMGCQEYLCCVDVFHDCSMSDTYGVYNTKTIFGKKLLYI